MLAGLCLLVLAAANPLCVGGEAADHVQRLLRGEYLFRVAGCEYCHTDRENGGAPLAGGRAVRTGFGTFRSPNISPDIRHGIGTWSGDDFARALGQGTRPDGRHYFPAFPCTAFTRMTRDDMLDVKARLMTRAAVGRANAPHEVHWPFSARGLVGLWKRVNFRPGALPFDAIRSPDWNRGACLVEAVSHGGECHRPRGVLGGITRHRYLAGGPMGLKGWVAPNITSHPDDGIGSWTDANLQVFLRRGFRPDGETIGGPMG